MATIAERLKTAMKLRGIKQSELVALTGIGKSSISTYLTGEYLPKQKNIYKLAMALDVNEAWLMGESVQMDRIDWDACMKELSEQREKISGFAGLLAEGLSFEDPNDEFLIYKTIRPDPAVEKEEQSILLHMFHISKNDQLSKMRTLRILTELVSVFNDQDQEKLVAFAEFLENDRQKRRGITVKHSYQDGKQLRLMTQAAAASGEVDMIDYISQEDINAIPDTEDEIP